LSAGCEVVAKVSVLLLTVEVRGLGAGLEESRTGRRSEKETV
jgi:hypothetical protein